MGATFSYGDAVGAGARWEWELWARVSSVVLAGVGLVVLSPVLALIAVAIRWESDGGVIYRQARVGRDGRLFVMLKFRSMRAGAEQETGPVWAAEDDERVTRVGWWLRRLHLDELPQLWNVLLGDMNLIGPRPERPEFVEEFRRRIPGYALRHQVRPGMTGWAQVKIGYGVGVAGAQAKLKYDLEYLRRRSLRLDLRILAETMRVVAR
ncbi:MAG: hypothetical protein EPN33_02465 [Acidobacteria bacterium]|nr:MAG: hypothetical protein EPN33_02465 [Acidobacteriota bacterium]